MATVANDLLICFHEDRQFKAKCFSEITEEFM